MRFFLVLIIPVLFLTSSFAGNNSMNDSVSFVEDHALRNFYLEKIVPEVTLLPTSLHMWEGQDWAVLGTTGGKSSGDFKMVDDFEENNEFSVYTKSILTFKESGLRLYGAFTYSGGTHDYADWNMFYKKSEIGSPFRIVAQRTGEWSTQHYGLEGYLSKVVNDRLTLGLACDYYGDLYFRMRDTRNEQFNLDVTAKASATYAVRENKFLTLGVDYLYKKSKPHFNNEYSIPFGETELYSRSVNTGLGDFDAFDDTEKIRIIDRNPRLTLGFNTKGKHMINTNYSIYVGDETWNRYIASTESDEAPIPYNYEYMQHKFAFSDLVKKNGSIMRMAMDVEYLSGDGFVNGTVKQKTYVYSGLKANASFDFLRDKSFFDQNNLTLSFTHDDKKDMIYAQKMSYTNVKVSATTGVKFQVNSLNSIQWQLGGTFKYNLAYTHNTVAASQKPFTINLAYNEMAYFTSDYVEAHTRLSWFHEMKKTAVELVFEYGFMMPTQVKINNDYSKLSADSSFRNAKLQLNLLF